MKALVRQKFRGEVGVGSVNRITPIPPHILLGWVEPLLVEIHMVVVKQERLSDGGLGASVMARHMT